MKIRFDVFDVVAEVRIGWAKEDVLCRYSDTADEENDSSQRSHDVLNCRLIYTQREIDVANGDYHSVSGCE